MLPETRALISLMERFKPDRIVSVHAHERVKVEGDAPGVFVDPKGGIDPVTRKARNQAGAADDELTRQLAVRAAEYVPAALRNEAFAGNTFVRGSAKNAGSSKNAGSREDVGSPGNVHYASSEHGEGNSLGMYAPVATSARQAATTITVEVPKFVDKGALDQTTQAHADAIYEVILGGVIEKKEKKRKTK
ncbi:hypothetical protein [Embleya sp. AB8]|uniref:hypothetical protein n=1 Tax=Embleya sp. AB8 TaxID=3156304 RepID=UPI003C73BFD7